MKLKALCLVLTVIIFSLFLLTACKQEEAASELSNYWQNPGYYKEEVYMDGALNHTITKLTLPIFWFHYDISDGVFANASASGELLASYDLGAEDWIPININWDAECYMTVTNADGDVLLSGKSAFDGMTTVITFYVEKNNVYPDMRESFVMQLAPSTSMDGPVYTKVIVQ